MSGAELILHSGRLRTLDSTKPHAEATAIAQGDVLAVGSNADVLAFAGRRTVAVDLGGAAVTPRLTDSHLHPFWGAMIARGCDLTGARSLDDVRVRLIDERARCAAGEWVLGFGLDYNVFEPSGVDRSVLEQTIGAHPALLTFSDLHTGLATREALAAAGIDGPRLFEERAEVVCVNGVPTGELREIPALDLVRAAIPRLGDAERYRLCVAQLRRLAAVGLTAAHVMDGDLATLDLVRELEANGDLVTRLILPFWIKPDTPEEYRRAVSFFAHEGFQCVTHATGDRGVHEALNAYRDAGPPAQANGALHRVEHIETIQPDDLLRFADESVAASMQPRHLMWLSVDRSDNWSTRLGPERCSRAYPMRALLESGALVALGSDWPVVHYDPREGLAAAQLRRPAGETTRPPYDENGLGALTALRGYTTMAAAAVDEQSRNGKLRRGFRADLTVMADDPVECRPDELPNNEILMTVVAGQIVHAGSGFA
jgi:predicted amidohydrolase YtcJ